jgi:hypothetical protein
MVLSFALPTADKPSYDLTCLGADSLPNLRTVDWNIGIDLEAQLHARALNIEYGDFQQAMKTIGPADDNRLQIPPR